METESWWQVACRRMRASLPRLRRFTYSEWSWYIRGKLLVVNETMWDWASSIMYSEKILCGLIPRGQLFFSLPGTKSVGFFLSRGFVLSQSCALFFLLLLNKWINSSYFGVQAKATQFLFLKRGCLQNQATNENVFSYWLLMEKLNMGIFSFTPQSLVFSCYVVYYI